MRDGQGLDLQKRRRAIVGHPVAHGNRQDDTPAEFAQGCDWRGVGSTNSATNVPQKIEDFCGFPRSWSIAQVARSERMRPRERVFGAPCACAVASLRARTAENLRHPARPSSGENGSRNWKWRRKGNRATKVSGSGRLRASAAQRRGCCRRRRTATESTARPGTPAGEMAAAEKRSCQSGGAKDNFWLTGE